MNSIFLDSPRWISRPRRINRNPSRRPGRLRGWAHAHHVDVLVMTPSEPLDVIALRHVRSLPAPIRFLMRTIGAMRRGGANLASYLLFEQGYCQELITLGYHDTMKRREEVSPGRDR
jgi:NTE family protein